MELDQLFFGKITAGKITHQNSGEQALTAAGREVASYLKNGGVVHYQRDLAEVSTEQFYQTVLIDLLWLERVFGKIIRLKKYNRGSTKSKQLFLTIRLENKIIVQYGLNSLAGLAPTFSFDFSSKGFNLDFDDQIQAPIRLNSTVQVDVRHQSEINETEFQNLKRIWELLDFELKGDD